MAVLNTTSPTPATSAPRGRPTNARPSSSTKAANPLAGNDHRLVDAVLLHHLHLDPLGVGGGGVLADLVGPDRQLAGGGGHPQRKPEGGRGARTQPTCQWRPARANLGG